MADPRTARTVTSLEAALRECLESQPLDAVNVSSLCRLASVRRTTFYTHFSSVADLLTSMLTSEIDALLSVSPAASVSETAAVFQDTLVDAFGLVTRDRHLFRVGFESDASAPLRRALHFLFARRLEVALSIWHAAGEALEVDAPVATAFAAGGLAASVEAWAVSDDVDSVAWAGAVRDQMAPWWPRG